MSMLKYFFEVGCDNTLFDGLEIAQEKELCDRFMGKFPVIFISLKGISGSNFATVKRKFFNIIGKEALRFSYLMESSRLSEIERKQYKALVNIDDAGVFTMEEMLLEDSLLLLS